jgi:hypothetical protein
MILFLTIITSCIYGSGHISSDALSWMDQMDGVKEHHNNFPSLVKILFASLSIYWGKVWHFNFVQNLIVYSGAYYVIFYSLKNFNVKDKVSSFFSSAFILFFFFNPYILSHTSKWYIDYIFSGILLCAFAAFLAFSVHKRRLVLVLGILLWYLAMGLRYNAPVLILSTFFILYLMSGGSGRRLFFKAALGSLAGFFVLFVTIKLCSLLFEEYESYAHLTVPYYETLGVISDHPNGPDSFIQQFLNVKIDLRKGLEYYPKLECAIPSLHQSSFKDVLKSPEDFQSNFFKIIVRDHFFDYLKTKQKHFGYFMSSENPCSFTHQLEPNYKTLVNHVAYGRVFEDYGEPWRSYFPNWKLWSEQKVLAIRESSWMNFMMINLYFSTILMMSVLLLPCLISNSYFFKLKFQWVLASMSVSILLSFLLANLGAFEKYRFPVLLMNWMIIYIVSIGLLNIKMMKVTKGVS